MKIVLHRFEYGTNYTIGKLYIDDVYQCYTLEDKVRETKIKDESAIWTGVYKLIVDFSTRFQKMMPHILNVPEFEGIRIHSGNTDKDTSGCILVGETWAGTDFIANSRSAYNRIYAIILAAHIKGENITITVE